MRNAECGMRNAGVKSVKTVFRSHRGEEGLVMNRWIGFLGDMSSGEFAGLVSAVMVVLCACMAMV